MNVNLCGKQLIGGGWQSAGDESFEAVNPANGESLTPAFVEATAREVDAALSAARDSFLAVRRREPRWPTALLEAIASQIEGLGDELLERAESETALPRARLTGERARTCAQLRMFAQMVREGSWVEAVIDRGALRNDNPLGIMRQVDGEWTNRSL